MSTMQNLNTAGQTVSAVLGTALVNAVVHPLCTIKNLMMTKQLAMLKKSGGFSTIKMLYAGYNEGCLTESASYAVSLVANEWFKKQGFGPFACAIAAGVICTPVATIGEALMLNRQLGHSLNFQLLKRGLNVSGLTATLLREAPFCVAVFAMSPAIEVKMPFTNDIVNKAIAGVIAGSFAGALTGPADTIRALVQAKTDLNPNGMSFSRAATSTISEFSSIQGLKNAATNSATRALYIGIAVGMLNLLNNKIPECLIKSEAFMEKD